MVRSMTGFGRFELNEDGKKVSTGVVSLESTLQLVKKCSAKPWFVIDSAFSVEELNAFLGYIGGGITYYLSTPVMSAKFINSYMEVLEGELKEALVTGTMTEAQAKELANKLSDKLQDDGLNTNIGGHILLGLRAKLPIIPIAAYVNGKYYFGLDYDDEIDASAFVLEAGIGFAL